MQKCTTRMVFVCDLELNNSDEKVLPCKQTILGLNSLDFSDIQDSAQWKLRAKAAFRMPISSVKSSFSFTDIRADTFCCLSVHWCGNLSRYIEHCCYFHVAKWAL